MQNKIPEKIFLNELNEKYYSPKQLTRPLILVGTCIKIQRANEMIYVFLLEDITKAHIVEIFRDKLPLDYEINLGDKLMIKGFYTQNKYREKIIRGFKISRINVTEEFLFYLEILKNRKTKYHFYDEEEILKESSRKAEEKYVGQDPSDNFLKKKIFSMIFYHFLENVKLLKENNGFVSKEQIEEIECLKVLRSKIKEPSKFDYVFEDALEYFKKIKLMVNFQEGYLFLMNFFTEFDDQFSDLMKESMNYNKRETFQIRTAIKVVNNMIEDNDEYLINKEIITKYIKRQIKSKKMYYRDHKKKDICMFEFN